MASASSEPLPVANRPATVWGISITIQSFALLAVGLRLLARYKLAHGYGFDDVFVVLACLTATGGTVILALQPSAGLGQHQSSLKFSQLERFFQYTIGLLLAYTLSVALIKISILLQYNRLAGQDRAIFRRLCWVMVFLVAAWGIIFFFIIIFGCIPFSGYWDLFSTSSGRCILFGAKDKYVRLQAYIAQSLSNMILDVIVFVMPLYMLKSTSLSTGSKLGLLGLFSLGATVVVISVLRLVSIIRDSLGLTQETVDITYYTPMTIIWSCIEANVAVVCASIPVFWPVLAELALGKIVVTNEVEVRSDLRSSARFSWRFNQSRKSDEMELTHSLGWKDSYAKVEISNNGAQPG